PQLPGAQRSRRAKSRSDEPSATAAALTVAQQVVDRLEHHPTGGNLRSVAGVFAASGDDAVTDGADRRFAVALHGLDSPTSDGTSAAEASREEGRLVRAGLP